MPSLSWHPSRGYPDCQGVRARGYYIEDKTRRDDSRAAVDDLRDRAGGAAAMPRRRPGRGGVLRRDLAGDRGGADVGAWALGEDRRRVDDRRRLEGMRVRRAPRDDAAGAAAAAVG